MTYPRTRSALGRFIYREDVRRDLERMLEEIESRTGLGSSTIQQQVYINGVTGDDTNDGKTPDRPIKTLAALDAILGVGQIEQFTEIFLAGDFSNEILSVRVSSAFIPNTTTIYPLAIVGQPTILRRGSITATSNQVIPSALPPNITDPTVVSWLTAGPGGSSLIGKRLRITDAPADPTDVGKIMWLKRDEGAGVVSTSFPSLLGSPSSNSINPPTVGGLVNPPYQYVVEEMVKIGGFVHNALTSTRVNILNIGSPGTITTPFIQANGGFTDKIVVFDGCDLEINILTDGALGIIGSRLSNANIFGTLAIIIASLVDSGPIQNSMRQLFLGGNTLSIGNSLYVGSTFASSSAFCGLIQGGASAFDAPAEGVLLEIGSVMHAFGGLTSGTLHGTGNGIGVKVGSNSVFSYDTLKSVIPTITGATEVLVGTTPSTWAAIDLASGLIELVPPTLARVVKK